MQDPAEKALKLLDLLVRRSEKEERLTELLRSSVSGETPGWSFHVPACFNDALDIRQTLRKQDGKSVTTWTQGPNFAFSPGDVLYDSPQAYAPWSEALKHVNRCVQVKEADSGTVNFDVLTPRPDRGALVFSSSHALSQQDFVRFLISGKVLANECER